MRQSTDLLGATVAGIELIRSACYEMEDVRMDGGVRIREAHAIIELRAVDQKTEKQTKK